MSLEPGTSTPARVVVTDDHGIIRHALRAILDRSAEFTLVGEASDAESALDLVNRERPDILVLDLGLPNMSGIEVLREIRKLSIPTRVVVLSMYEDETKVIQALRGGAMSYVLKNASPSEFLEALTKARNGEIYLPQKFEHLREHSQNGSNGSEPADGADPLSILSPRERQLFFLIAEGLPNRVIAKQLFISPRTVETHRARVIRKLGLKSNAELIRFAIRNGLIGT